MQLLLRAQHVYSELDSAFSFNIVLPFVINAAGDTVYRVEGNIVFEGAADSRQRIYLLIAPNLKNNNGEVDIYQPGKSTPVMTVVRQTISDNYTEQQLLYLKAGSSGYSLCSAFTDSVLVQITTLPDKNLLYLVMYMTATHFAHHLQPSRIRPAFQEGSGTRGFIKKAWGSQTATEWEWDGQILKLRWGGDMRRQWRFDGYSISRAWTNDINEEYAWEDNVLRPVWRSSARQDEWMFDGQVIKPVYSSDLKFVFRLDGNRVKPQFGNDPNQEWILDGSLPVPLIIFVISGMAFH